LIILFYPAIFLFLGKNVFNIIQIITLVFTLWLVDKYKPFSTLKKGDRTITVLFVVFSISFLVSGFFHEDNLFIISAHYARYFEIYCLWFLVRKEIIRQQGNVEPMARFGYDIILMQIIISIGKLIIFSTEGQPQIESLVGSLTLTGGAQGTTVPILGFIALWFYRNGKFNWKNWLFVVGLMLIGFTTGKRAVWFIMPFVIAGFLIYVPKLKLNKIMISALLISPLAFYLGARLTPSMNPERQVWGSFDLAYVFDYAKTYQFGDEGKVQKGVVAQGRGNATIWLFENLLTEDEFMEEEFAENESIEYGLTERDWWGSGLSTFYNTSYEEFYELGYGLAYKGAATGVFQSYVTTGYYGVFTAILFFFYMLWLIKHKRLRIILIGIVAWEYFMYTGMIFRNPYFMFLIIYFIHSSNLMMLQNKKLKIVT
jgi:hypothetical protein